MQRYNPKDIEPKWQAQWEADKIYQASEDPSKPKKYILEYFPYPSGAAMHVGHVRNYTIGDVLARFGRMAGYNVLHPMGWDSFGLPAENFAIKNQISPRVAIDQNTAKFKQQLMQMGFSYDWSREIDSSTPEYYRWTQWFFLLLFKRGLAYQQESLQWWCPVDKTVLANEQVESGKCWRCGSDVEKKSLKQWFFKITDYADRLSADLDNLDWSDSIKSMQRNWIGRSQGAQVEFASGDHLITVFTTRPDTLFGATFLVLAPEHPLVKTLTSDGQRQHVTTYVKAAQAKSDIERQETNREKTGVFTGSYATNPINGEQIPVWVADYVLAGYGTGAIMAVPGHDERDNAFARKFNLPIKTVVAPAFISESSPGERTAAIDRPAILAAAYNPDTEKYCLIRWHDDQVRAGLEWPGGGIDQGESFEAAVLREFTEETGYDASSFQSLADGISCFYYTGRAGQVTRNVMRIAKLQVNSLSHNGVVGTEDYEKQAYDVVWMTLDEIRAARDDFAPFYQTLTDYVLDDTIFTGEGALVESGDFNNQSSAEARENIVKSLETDGKGRAVTNYKMRDWLISRQRYWGAPIPIIHCPKDGAVADDNLPVELPELTKFEPSGDGRSPLANVADFVHTTCPRCGGPAERETDTMDGFACSSWYFLRFADPHNDEKPFDDAKAKFWLPVDDYIGGAEHAVMHLLYARMWTKVMHDEGLIDFDEPFTTLRNHGMILAPDGQKMSKSKGNTIEPGVLIEQGYGADSIRIMELFLGPWNQPVNWSVEGMAGSFRFLQRVWTLVQEFLAAQQGSERSAELDRAIHRTIKKVGQDVEAMSFNTAISAMMELVNDLYKIKAADNYAASNWQESLQAVSKLLAPFAPHIAEEIWQQLGGEGSVHVAAWPAFDDGYLTSDSMKIAVQINGKVRSVLEVAADSSEDNVVAAAKADQKVAQLLDGKEPRKIIYIAGKIVNIVV